METHILVIPVEGYNKHLKLTVFQVLFGEEHIYVSFLNLNGTIHGQ